MVYVVKKFRQTKAKNVMDHLKILSFNIRSFFIKILSGRDAILLNVYVCNNDQGYVDISAFTNSDQNALIDNVGSNYGLTFKPRKK